MEHEKRVKKFLDRLIKDTEDEKIKWKKFHNYETRYITNINGHEIVIFCEEESNRDYGKACRFGLHMLIDDRFYTKDIYDHNIRFIENMSEIDHKIMRLNHLANLQSIEESVKTAFEEVYKNYLVEDLSGI